MNQQLDVEDLHDAARQLAGSRRGREALAALKAWFDEGGLLLDVHNQAAVSTLLEGAWGRFAGTAREAIAAALDACGGASRKTSDTIRGPW